MREREREKEREREMAAYKSKNCLFAKKNILNF